MKELSSVCSYGDWRLRTWSISLRGLRRWIETLEWHCWASAPAWKVSGASFAAAIASHWQKKPKKGILHNTSFSNVIFAGSRFGEHRDSVSVTNQSIALTLPFVRQTQKDAQLKANWTIFDAITTLLRRKRDPCKCYNFNWTLNFHFVIALVTLRHPLATARIFPLWVVANQRKAHYCAFHLLHRRQRQIWILRSRWSLIVLSGIKTHAVREAAAQATGNKKFVPRLSEHWMQFLAGYNDDEKSYLISLLSLVCALLCFILKYKTKEITSKQKSNTGDWLCVTCVI